MDNDRTTDRDRHRERDREEEIVCPICRESMLELRRTTGLRVPKCVNTFCKLMLFVNKARDTEFSDQHCPICRAVMKKADCYRFYLLRDTRKLLT